MRKLQTGFTLIEVMIVVAIVAILAAIAVPNYTEYVTRSRIIEGTALLSDARVKMEQYFQDTRSYTPGPEFCTNTSKQIKTKHFAVGCDGLSATAYTLTGTGSGPMTGFSFTVNEANTKATATVPSGWNKPSPNNCWAVRKSGDCAQ